MPWMISADSVEKIIHDVEKKLYACGYDNAVSILLHSFAEERQLTYVPEENLETLQGCYLNLLSSDRLVDTPDTISRKRGIKLCDRKAN